MIDNLFIFKITIFNYCNSFIFNNFDLKIKYFKRFTAKKNQTSTIYILLTLPKWNPFAPAADSAAKKLLLMISRLRINILKWFKMRKREKMRTKHPNFMKILPIDHRMDAPAFKHRTSINETWRCPIRFTGKHRRIWSDFKRWRRTARLMISISFHISQILRFQSKMGWLNDNRGEHYIKRKLRIKLLKRLTKTWPIV